MNIKSLCTTDVYTVGSIWSYILLGATILSIQLCSPFLNVQSCYSLLLYHPLDSLSFLKRQQAEIVNVKKNVSLCTTKMLVLQLTCLCRSSQAPYTHQRGAIQRCAKIHSSLQYDDSVKEVAIIQCPHSHYYYLISKMFLPCIPMALLSFSVATRSNLVALHQTTLLANRFHQLPSCNSSIPSHFPKSSKDNGTSRDIPV